MTDPWVEPSYVKVGERRKNNVAIIASHLAERVQNEDESRNPYIRMKFNKTSKNVKEYFRTHFEKEYQELFPKK